MVGRVRVSALLGGAAVWVVACLVPNETGTDRYVEFTLAVPPLFVGDSAQLAAVVRDGTGEIVAGVDVHYVAADAGIADVEPATGRIRARAEGRTAVRAFAPDWPNTTAATDTLVVRPGVPAGVRELFPDTVATKTIEMDRWPMLRLTVKVSLSPSIFPSEISMGSGSGTALPPPPPGRWPMRAKTVVPVTVVPSWVKVNSMLLSMASPPRPAAV